MLTTSTKQQMNTIFPISTSSTNNAAAAAAAEGSDNIDGDDPSPASSALHELLLAPIVD
jgi:hypothetical protein